MDSTAWLVVASVVATVFVIVVTMLAVAVVNTLGEVRLVARRVRELLERVGPDLEQTIADVRLTAGNAREVTTLVANGAHSVQKLALGIGQLRLPKVGVGRTGIWAMLAAAVTAFLTVLRRRRARANATRR